MTGRIPAPPTTRKGSSQGVFRQLELVVAFISARGLNQPGFMEARFIESRFIESRSP